MVCRRSGFVPSAVIARARSDNGLLRIVRRHFDACPIGHLLGRASEIKANNRLARRHRLETHPPAGIVEARMDQHVAGGEHLERVGPRL